MTLRTLLACFAVSAGCGFGDNQPVRVQPDSGTGTVKSDAIVTQPTADALLDAPLATACTLVPQGGCSGSTPACDVGDDAKVFCRAVTVQGTSNSHCAADTECSRGYTCTDDGTSKPGWCARFCADDSGCTGTGSRCVIGLSANGNSLGVDVCSNACDPRAQTGCPANMGCLPFESAGGDYTDCAYVGTVANGQACTTSRECAAGSICVQSGATSVCRALCVAGNNFTCNAGQSCAGFANALTIGTTTYGFCR